MRQLAGHVKAELVWVWSNSVNRCTPAPISPRRYQPPICSWTCGAIICGACMIGGRSAALADVRAAAIAAPANKATFRLRMTPSSRTRWTEGRPDTETMGADSQLIFKRRLTLKLNPDFSLPDFVGPCAIVARATRRDQHMLSRGAEALTREPRD